MPTNAPRSRRSSSVTHSTHSCRTPSVDGPQSDDEIERHYRIADKATTPDAAPTA